MGECVGDVVVVTFRGHIALLEDVLILLDLDFPQEWEDGEVEAPRLVFEEDHVVESVLDDGLTDLEIFW